MEATLTSFWVSLPARAGPEPRSWPRLTSTTFSQVSSPRVQHMNQGEGRKHSEHSPERMRCETPVAEATKREGRRENARPTLFPEPLSTVSGPQCWAKHQRAGRKAQEKGHTWRTQSWSQQEQTFGASPFSSQTLPWTTTLRNDLSFAPLSKNNRNESLAVQRPSEIVHLISAWMK